VKEVLSEIKRVMEAETTSCAACRENRKCTYEYMGLRLSREVSRRARFKPSFS
jgi:hypothetical protein